MRPGSLSLESEGPTQRSTTPKQASASISFLRDKVPMMLFTSRPKKPLSLEALHSSQVSTYLNYCWGTMKNNPS